MQKVLLSVENISKTFPGVKALDGISFKVVEGEVHGLVGENGAGKSTLIKILAGVEQPDEGGRIVLEGKAVKFTSALDSAKAGISVIYQDFSLFPNLSVAENIAIKDQIEEKKSVVNWRLIYSMARRTIEKLGVEIDLDEQVGKLSVAKQQLVAIARALAHNAKLKIMDEPTSALSKNEIEALFKVIRSLKEEGIAVLFVSHKLEELFEITDRMTILRDGKYMGTYKKEELDEERLISLMVGRKIDIIRKEKKEFNEVVLEVKNLTKRGNFKDITFKLHKGEILGITGLVGAGRTEVVQAIFGIEPADSGEIYVEGRKVEIKSSEDAVKLGIAYVPENRQTQGLITRESIKNNIVITVLKRLVGRMLINPKKKDEIAIDWIKKLNIKPSYPDMLVQNLSGGNQQRVVIAKWLATNSKILIIDEPTNGIDVGAKSEIHNILKELASKGMAILMISSELPEVLSLSDRILVMRKGRIVAEFEPDNVTQEIIMNAALLGNNSERINYTK